MIFGEKLRQLRTNKGYSMDGLIELYNKKFDGRMNKSTLSRYENGIQEPMYTVVKNLAELFNVTVDFLSGVSDIPNSTDGFVTFPVMGEIAAGYDNLATEDWDRETVTIFSEYLKGRPESDYFVLEVKGDSMFPEYRNGDKVLILKQSTLDYSGQVGAVIYNDTYATLKKVEYKDGEDWMNLVPVNPSVQTQRIEGEALEHCKVLGVPRLLIREIKQ